MRWYASLVALIALVAALSLPVRANIAPAAQTARLDPARVFNPNAESLLAALFAPEHLSPIDVVLFGVPDPAATNVPVPAPAVARGTGVLTAVNLRAFAPAVQLPSRPLEEPSVAPVSAVPAHPQLAQAPVRLAAPPAASVHFGSYTPYVPAVQNLSGNVNVPVRVGAVHFSGVVSGSQAQTTRVDAVRAMQLCGTTDEAAACPYLHDERTQDLAAGTAFNVRAGNAQLNLQVSGTVGHVSAREDGALFEYAPLAPDTHFDAASVATPADSSLLYYPGLTDVVRHGVNARLAVPVTRAVTVGVQYDYSHYQGNYGDLLAPGIDATKNTYQTNVTYQLPNSSSLLTLSAGQYRYQDSSAPNFNLRQTRADLDFTVKF